MKNDFNKILNSYIKNLSKLLDNYKSDLPADVKEKIKRLIKNDIDKIFTKQEGGYGRYDGVGTGLFNGGSKHWVELAPKTIKKYEKLGYEPAPTLHRTGELQNSIRVEYRGNLSFEISVNTPYAAIHQFGGGNIPARPYIVIQDSTKEAIEKEIEEGFNEYIKTHQKELYS